MNACPPLERLIALLRGEVGESEGGEIEDHLDLCEPCRRLLHAVSDWELSADLGSSKSFPGIGLRSRALFDRLASLPSPRATGGSDPVERGRSAAGDAREGLPGELPGFGGIREVGRGGMGIVYRAEQRGLERPVALKIRSDGRTAGADSRERFRREILALARLRHPNVVRIYGVDEHDGLDFLVMEWVEGGDLSHRLREGPLPMREAVELALPLAGALQAAHDRGIIHRDLKPSNILLPDEGIAGPDRRGRLIPKISDFGLAKLIEDDAGLTFSGPAMGSPSYMAPEQTGLLGKSSQGPATDVYGLGAILYEMLVGRPPFRGSSRHETICQVVAGDVVPPRRLRPQVPRDLETICLKCLEREPGRRYPTAKALAEELERFLEGRPIQARRAAAWEIGWQWCRRKPTEAGLLIALVLMFLAGFASVTWLWRRADAESLRASRAADAESRQRAEAQAEVAVGDLDRGIALARAGAIDQGMLWMAQSIRKAPAERPDLLRLARDNLDAWNACTIPLRAILEHQAMINHAVYSLDGSAILTGSNDGTAQFWDATTGRPLRPPIRHGDQVLCVAISRDGRLVATGGADRRARLWEAESGRPIGSPFFHRNVILSVAISRDGRLLATRDIDRVAQVWDVATGQPVGPSIDRGAIRSVRFTAGGRSLATGGEDGVVRFWSTRDGPAEGRELYTGAPIDGILFGPEPPSVAIWHADQTVRVWDSESGRAITPPLPNGDVPLFSPDGKLLLTLGPGDHARLWDLASGRAFGPMLRHPPSIDCAAFSPDGRTVLTGGRDHTARLWDVATGRMIGPVLRHRLPIRDVAFAPDGRSFLTSSSDGTARIWRLDAIAPRSGPTRNPPTSIAGARRRAGPPASPSSRPS